jgi:acyl-[acyl carrier protein]--UDP-N-acetylglucosamine O-acyltransferase
MSNTYNRIISVFKEIFYSEGLIKNKIEDLLEKYKNNDEVVCMLEFIKNSPRGVTTVKHK